jgi:hypothetical protein
MRSCAASRARPAVGAVRAGHGVYLGGLRLAQARDCRQFLDAAMSWKHATENLICGDVDGNIRGRRPR